MATKLNVVKRSLIIAFAERYSISALQFISIMVLARILTPEEIGIYTVALAVISFAQVFRDFGVSQYLVQEKVLNKKKVAAALGVTTAIALPLGILAYASAPVIANYYDEPLIRSVIEVSAINFFLLPIGALAPDLLKRGMSFGTRSKINLGSAVTHVTMSISLALMGFGVMSMAWATVGSSVVTAALGQLYLPKKYRVLPSLRGSRAVFSFGTYTLGSNISEQMGTSVADMLIGRVLGFSSLGLFSRARGFNKMYASIFRKATNPVIHANFARENRGENGIGPSYVQTMDYVTLVGWSLAAFMGCMAERMIYVLFGEQWLGAAPIASVLCVGLLISIVNGINQTALVAMGEVRLIFNVSLLFNVLRLVIVLMTVNSGLLAVAAGMSAAFGIRFLIDSAVVYRIVNIEIKRVLKIYAKNLMSVAIICALPLYYLLNPMTDEISILPAIKELVFAGTSSLIAFVCVVVVSNHPAKSELVSLIETFCRGKSGRPAD